ncbi:MAG TPA: xylulokinase [Ornithinimicrobium sp.]|uniref:xylulokinase n=1 Tax=Ornithinimicrobium sp. TaxID=1977084 RepID=UPI002B46510F|nr:xylulokinase [Ornithinimicrobium sp.]HKJ11453.1 xylulokinase [Ornithinimicrobium sp.]
MSTLVAGIDSSTQSCKVVIRDAETGELVRSGQASHPNGTEVHPDHWWDALREAAEKAGGLGDVEAVAVGGQQHGLVALDSSGEVIRPALLWNDTRSASAAAQLTEELEGSDEEGRSVSWASETGSLLVPSITVTKLRWLADEEPDHAAAVAAVALPHDWLTWKLLGAGSLDALVTDRSDASGTGYFDPAGGDYRRDLLAMALRRDDASDIVLPRVLGPAESAGQAAAAGLPSSALVGPGAGDNAAAALGLGMKAGDLTLSIGTSAVVSAVAAEPVQDPQGTINGFADATGQFLPLVVMLNGSRVLDATAAALQVGHEELADLALKAEPGAGGLTLVPYLDGERVPDLPEASGSLWGITRDNLTPENLARAAVEGILCGLSRGIEALSEHGVPVQTLHLVGGGARSRAVQEVAPVVFGRPVSVPPAGEYVADGMARQSAWVLAGTDSPPQWSEQEPARHVEGEHHEHIRQTYDARAAVVASAW